MFEYSRVLARVPACACASIRARHARAVKLLVSGSLCVAPRAPLQGAHMLLVAEAVEVLNNNLFEFLGIQKLSVFH